MEKGRELAQLNLVLELVSDFASLTRLDDVTRTIEARLRWILDFDQCALQLVRDGSIDAGETPPVSQTTLVERALVSGAPASAGKPISAIAYPLGPSEKPLGVLYLSARDGGFSYRDLRLLHHICSSLGAVLSRIHHATLESALRANEARLQNLNTHLEHRVAERTLARGRAWEVSPELLCVVDAHGNFETTNPAWERTLGWSEAELTGQAFTMLVHPDDLGATHAAWADANERRSTLARVENRCRTQHGAWRHLSWVMVPEDGKVYCIARDVTEEKIQRDTLVQRTDERDVLAAMFQATDLFIQVVDVDYRFVAINQASIDEYWRAFGRRVAIGDCLSDVLAGLPEQREAALALWGRALAGEAFTQQQNFGDASLRQRTYEMRFETLRAADGTQIGAFMTSVDVTDALLQERALADTQDALRQSQKLEAIGQLTGGVAHDFNNILAVIKASTELLRRTQANDERRHRFTESISNAVNRGARLTGQLLAFARRQALQPEVFDAEQNTRGIAEMISSLTGAGVEIVLQLHGEACFIDADPSQFDTALVNLAVNARDAMQSKGTLTLDVRLVQGIPASRSHPAVAGDFVAVSVQDTGSGIDADNIDKIFEPFFTTKAVGHGTGLGLSQVFGFARQSGGDVRVDSVVGNGSTFTLYLPRVQQAIARNTVEKPVSMPSGAGLKVLAVEDNAELAGILESMLDELGYVTTVVSSAERALDMLRENRDRFAVVFADVVLPGINGVDLSQVIAALRLNVPVVLTSGYSHVLTQNLDNGFVLVPKPYALADLARGLDSAIQGRRMVDSVRQRAIEATSTSARKSLQQAASAPPDQVEAARLTELAAMRIMDSEEETAYDELTRLAASFCQTPIALISLVDGQRQWFKSRVGLQAAQTPREYAFCAHAIEQPGQVMQVTDARLDSRFAGNPLVTEEPGIRFYAGAPLVTSTGHALGTLCVIDTQPRTLTASQLDTLQMLAARVVERLEARRAELGLNSHWH